MPAGTQLSSVATARSLTRPLDLAGARAVVLGFSATMLLAVLLAAAASFALGVANEGRVLPGVRVGDIALGGLDRDAVAAKLAAGLPALTDSTVTLTGSGHDLTLWRSDLGRAYDIGAMVDAAYGTGRGDNPALSVVAIGPSTGFTDGEARVLVSAGFAPARLAAARLRTETAALVWAGTWASRCAGAGPGPMA